MRQAVLILSAGLILSGGLCGCTLLVDANERNQYGIDGSADFDGGPAECGDGDVEGDERCDDGDLDDGDGCGGFCRVESGWTCAGSPSRCREADEVCGDGLLVGLEACDDGNPETGDGCSAACDVEGGWVCVGNEPSACSPDCGDGALVDDEACDDDNELAGDGCSASCEVEDGWACSSTPSVCDEICGDRSVVGREECDDGNTAAGDGCGTTCDLEMGWRCDTAGVPCGPVCGDGAIVGLEACDDDNEAPSDGCSDRCELEVGWECVGTPSVCTTTCGDGRRVGPEACDDGNTSGGDGCSAGCGVESGWTCPGVFPSVCADVDECIAGTHTCPADVSLCVNESPGFSCPCTCGQTGDSCGVASNRVFPASFRDEDFDTTGTISSTVIVGQRVLIDEDTRLAEFETGTTGGGQVRLGLYTDVGGLPGVQLARTVIRSTGTGTRRHSLDGGGCVELTASTWYWIVWVGDGAATYRRETNERLSRVVLNGRSLSEPLPTDLRAFSGDWSTGTSDAYDIHLIAD